MTEREALMLALKALQSDDYWTHVEAVNAIHKALAQPEQEPVGFIDDGGLVFWKDKPPEDGADLYTTPPQRTWVGLTDEEIDAEHDRLFPKPVYDRKNVRIFTQAIEAKLKEKNT